MELRKEYIPLIKLHQILGIPPTYENSVEGQIVIVESHGKKYCILVDDIIDQQQIVIKSLEENFVQLPAIAGATILGDGQVSMILDIPGLVQKYYQHKKEKDVVRKLL